MGNSNLYAMKKTILLSMVIVLSSWNINAQDFRVDEVIVYSSLTPPTKVSGDSIALLDTVSLAIDLYNVGSNLVGPNDSVAAGFSVNGSFIGNFGKRGIGTNLVPSTSVVVPVKEKHVFTSSGSVKICAWPSYTGLGGDPNKANDTSCKIFTVFPPPGVLFTSFSPSEGYRGSKVNLDGFRFSDTATQNVVKINGVNAVVDSAEKNFLRIIVPATATSGKISVTTAGKTSTAPGTYTVRVPVINSFSPDSAFVTDTVRVLCTDVITKPIVKFNGTITPAADVIWNGDTVWAEVPVGATTGKIMLDFDITTASSATDFIVRMPIDTSKDTTSVRYLVQEEGKIWHHGSHISITNIIGVFDLTVVDLNGKVVLSKELKLEDKSEFVEVDVSGLNGGTYIAIIDKSYFKFVKME